MENEVKRHNPTKHILDMIGGLFAMFMGVLLIVDKILTIVEAGKYDVSIEAIGILMSIVGIGQALVFIILGAKSCKAPEYQSYGKTSYWSNNNGIDLALVILGFISGGSTLLTLLFIKYLAVSSYIEIVYMGIVFSFVMAIIKIIARKMPDEAKKTIQPVINETYDAFDNTEDDIFDNEEDNLQ